MGQLPPSAQFRSAVRESQSRRRDPFWPLTPDNDGTPSPVNNTAVTVTHAVSSSDKDGRDTTNDVTRDASGEMSFRALHGPQLLLLKLKKDPSP